MTPRRFALFSDDPRFQIYSDTDTAIYLIYVPLGVVYFPGDVVEPRIKNQAPHGPATKQVAWALDNGLLDHLDPSEQTVIFDFIGCTRETWISRMAEQ